jgi:hypothetical protein
MKTITPDLLSPERVVLSPAQFAAHFGRHYTWAYRQIYAGKVKVLSKIGRIMIAKSEVERLVADQTTYTGGARASRKSNGSKSARET